MPAKLLGCFTLSQSTWMLTRWSMNWLRVAAANFQPLTPTDTSPPLYLGGPPASMLPAAIGRFTYLMAAPEGEALPFTDLVKVDAASKTSTRWSFQGHGVGGPFSSWLIGTGR